MGGIEKLKEFGVKEIQDKTFIDAIYVESILNKDTEALARINKTKLNGFLNILEREYKISLDEMRGDFIVTKKTKDKDGKVEADDIKDLSKNKKKQKEKRITEIKVDIDKSSGKVFLNTERNSNDKRIIFAIILLGIIVYGYWYFTNNLNMLTSDDNGSGNLIELSEVDNLDNNNSKNTQQDELFVGTGIENLKNEDTNKSAIDEQNITANSSVNDIDEKIATDNNQTTKAEVEIKKIENISINARKGRVWIGIFYLDTLKKDSKITKKLDIDLERSQLIITGHGLFDLNIDENKTKYNKQTKIRFLYKDNNFTEISKAEYKKLGKGKAW